MLVDGVAYMTGNRRASPSRDEMTLADHPVCGLSRQTGMLPNA
jgi:hypothetical protein